MSVEENLRLLDKATEATNAHDLDRFASYHVASVIQYTPGRAEPLKGRAALREYQQNFLTAFPDVHLRMERSFGQGDWICSEVIGTGTHKGPLKGPGGRTIPATNKPFRVPGCIVAKVEGGEFAETHVYFDQVDLMTQLGLTP